MYCQSCGTRNLENARFCSGCGQALPVPNQMPNQSVPYGNIGTLPNANSYPSAVTNYAGFWKRFGALLIDTVVLMVAGAIIGGVFGFVLGAVMGASGANVSSIQTTLTIMGYGIGILLNWLYNALLESSPQRASLGKMAFGIIVTDVNGERISFGKATGRYLVKVLLSGGLTFGIGYIVAASSAKKQALHDMLAHTFVLNK